MKNIVFFNSSMQMGGPARVICSWSNEFVRRGYTVEIVANTDKEIFYQFDSKIKFSTLGIDKFKQKSRIKTFFKFLFFLHDRTNEILIFSKALYIPYLYILKTLGLIRNETTLIYYAHGGSSDFKTFHNNFRNFMIAKTFDKILAVLDDHDSYNDYFYRSLKRKIIDRIFSDHWETIKKRISYIPNPLTFRSEEVVDHSEKIVLAVGRLDIVKGFDLLIKAWKKVSQQFPDWKLRIVGSGSENANLKRQITELMLESSVEMIPESKDIKFFYLHSSIYVMSSREEGFGLVVTEAMECGLPIIAFDNVGAKYIVQNEVNGILCKIGDTEKLTENVIKLILDINKRKEYGAASKRLVKRFYIEALMGKWEEVLN